MLQVIFAALFAFLIGLAFLLYGYRLFLVMLPIWGFFAGFWLGAQTIAMLLGGGFLATTTGWVVGFATGLLLAVLSGPVFTHAGFAFGDVGVERVSLRHQLGDLRVHLIAAMLKRFDLLGRFGGKPDAVFLRDLSGLASESLPAAMQYPNWKATCEEALADIQKRTCTDSVAHPAPNQPNKAEH